MAGKILLIDDEKNWGEILADLLKDEGYEVIWAQSKLDAEYWLALDHKIDLIITNINLKPSSLVLDGQGYQILENIRNKHSQLPTIVISALQERPGIDKVSDGRKMARKVIELYDKYGVAYVAIKGDIDINELTRKIGGIISSKGNGKDMNWETMIAIAVSAVSPYVVTLGTSAFTSAGTKLGESISSGISELWEWIHKHIEAKGDQQDKDLLKSFQQEPAKHRDKLKRTLLNIVPEEDIVLCKLTQDLMQDLFKLLDDPNYFMLQDLKKICGQLNVDWESDVDSSTREALARWAVNFARSRRKEHELIEAMIKTNPDAFSRPVIRA